MTFGEVVHYVTQPTGWPEPVRGIASLLSPFHCPDRPSKERLASPSTFSEPLASHEAPAPGSYTATDFLGLIHSTAAGLSALADLPHYGGERSTVPLWSQLLHALANTLSPEILILEDAPFVMPQAQNMASQPSNLIDGHATLLAAHAIFSTPRTHSDRSRTNSRNEEDEDESMYSAGPDSCDGSVDSLDLPLQAHILPGRGRCLSAVVPVLLVADSHNIIPLLCSTLYQRRVWGIHQPVVGLCCSSTGTTATAIFGWLDSDQSQEGRMPTAHLASAADFRLDPSMGVFDFTDTCSSVSLAQFVLGLRSHFQDIKGAISIEAVDSLTPLRWRSDLPDFETQFGGQLDERVASWTHQVHVQTSSSEASSSSTPRTPSPLFDSVVTSHDNMSSTLLSTISEDEQVGGGNYGLPQGTRATSKKGRGRRSKPLSSERSSQGTSSSAQRPPSPYPNSRFAALSDSGLKDEVSISNWLFERHAFTVGRLPVQSEELSNKTGINAMVKNYDQMTAFTWSDKIKTILSEATVDSSVLDIRSELCRTGGSPNRQSSTIDAPSSKDVPSLKDVEFISTRISALLHAVKGARQCDGVAQVHGANEADRRHEWDALLLNFFQPVLGQRDVLLERQLNVTRNLAADDSSFGIRAIEVARDYQGICSAQQQNLPLTPGPETNGSWEQAAEADQQALAFSLDITRRYLNGNFDEVIAKHSSLDPTTGKCDAVLVIPCSGAATTMLQPISSIDKQENLLKFFMLIQGPKPDENDSSTGETSNEIKKTIGRSQMATSDRPLQVPSSSRISDSKKPDFKTLHDPFFCHADDNQVTQRTEAILSKTSGDEPGGKDLLLPVLLAEYKKRDESAISTAMNQMRIYLVSALTFLSELGITDQPVFGLVVNGARGALTMGWKANGRIYVMDRNVRHYDITSPLQALQFVSVLPRLACHGLRLRSLLNKQLAIIDVNRLQSEPWSKFPQHEDEKLAAAKRQIDLKQAVAGDHIKSD
ncbi:hypothetical protein EDB19DRAFT_1179074 [Suillus lakei]|nr:hypothetical protein EDB19DRAFT_1179074 [Suillus lakei]